MKIFFDTEFIDNGKTIELISIGMVNELDEKLYCISSEFKESDCDDWLKNNVLSTLGNDKRISREEIKNRILKFCGNEKIKFYGYYSAYDWVVLCQLWGRMIDIPHNFPYYCNDLIMFNKDIKQENGNHNALDDAIWVKKTYYEITT